MPLRRVVELLAPALGEEKSSELVILTARERGYDPNRLTLERILDVLVSLGSSPGVVGVAARFARTRLLSRTKHSSGPLKHVQASAMPPEPPPPPRRVEAPAKVEATEIVDLLAHTIGTEKSRQIVITAMETFGIAGDTLDRDQAYALLDSLAKAQGVVGIASRFTKARLILRFEKS